MQRTTPSVLSIATALTLVAAGIAQATIVEELDLLQMVRRAHHIVHARVLDNRVVVDEQTRYQYTITRFEVLESAKGELSAGDELELRLIGGRAPGSYVETVVAEVPRFREDEEVVLFTTEGSDGRPLLLGIDGALRLGHGAKEPVVLSPPLEGSSGAPHNLDLVPRTLRRATLPRPAAAPEIASHHTGAAARVDIAPRQPAQRPGAVGLRAFMARVRELVSVQQGATP